VWVWKRKGQENNLYTHLAQKVFFVHRPLIWCHLSMEHNTKIKSNPPDYMRRKERRRKIREREGRNEERRKRRRGRGDEVAVAVFVVVEDRRFRRCRRSPSETRRSRFSSSSSGWGLRAGLCRPSAGLGLAGLAWVWPATGSDDDIFLIFFLWVLLRFFDFFFLWILL
jgi:hypothetical protein